MKIDIYFNGVSHDPRKEFLATKLCEKTARVISLPKHIEIEFKKMDHSVYGETFLFASINKRIKINGELTDSEMFYPIIHELIHLNQTHTGMLTVRRDGIYLWNNRPYEIKDNITYTEYQNLPWERDVTNRFQQVMSQVLSYRD